MDPILKKDKPTGRRTSTSSGDVTTTKKKSSRACAPCRKRKVKCNGEQPCERCSKTDTECIFDKQHQKRETPKSVADNHEPRLKKLEEFSVHFSKILEKTKVEPPFYYNPNQMQHTGSE
ncbi:hypothetical protein K501DRAFT_190577 [Backusella circina FSU 941]|nr:hypothetical protein K501DRAFT_190577 [Backusella circina FSU 941]